MDKREYIKANKDWLEAKAKEEGVKALPKASDFWSDFDNLQKAKIIR